MELLPTITLILSGLVLGVQHSFDGDHIIAVSAIVSRSRSLKRSAILGTLWGSGHTTTLLIVGMAVLIFRVNIPKSAETIFEAISGAALIAVGAVVIFNIGRQRPHTHDHRHGEIAHEHAHEHQFDPDHRHKHGSFLVGTIQGLAGSAGLMLVILSTINSVTVGLAYILFFGIGSIIGMILLATLMSLTKLKADNFPYVNKWLTSAIGAISIVFGLYLVYSQLLT